MRPGQHKYSGTRGNCYFNSKWLDKLKYNWQKLCNMFWGKLVVCSMQYVVVVGLFVVYIYLRCIFLGNSRGTGKFLQFRRGRVPQIVPVNSQEYVTLSMTEKKFQIGPPKGIQQRSSFRNFFVPKATFPRNENEEYSGNSLIFGKLGIAGTRSRGICNKDIYNIYIYILILLYKVKKII